MKIKQGAGKNRMGSPSSKNRVSLLPLCLTVASLVLLSAVVIQHPSQTQAPLLEWLLPALSGLLFFLSGLGIYFYLFPRAGLRPLLLFHFLAGQFFISLAGAQIDGRFAYLGMIFFAFLPSTLIVFTSLLSELFVDLQVRGTFHELFFFMSLALLIPALYFYQRNLTIWMRLGQGLGLSLAGAYFFWLLRLVWIFKKPHLDFDHLTARNLLLGQIIGFLLPLAAAALLFKRLSPISPYLFSPLILFFPLSLFLGIVPGERRQKETYFVQSEKRTSFGPLLAGLAHELNNPLNFIHSNLEPLREYIGRLKTSVPSSDSKSQKILVEMDRMVNDMEEGTTRAQTLIEKFRGFPGKKVEQKTEVDLNSIIERSIDLLAQKWKNKIIVEKKLDALPTFRAFPGEMEQVFSNLLANAFDATPEGGKVRVTTQKSPGGIRVSVLDTGKGIPKEEIGKIYDPFFTTKEQGKGTGLGLSISLQIIKNHRGSIEVKSEVGKGTEFLILFPY